MNEKSREIQDALSKIIKTEGPSCLKDVGKFRGLWMDFAPQGKESKLILSAVQEGAGNMLIKALDQGETEQRRTLELCVRRLTDAYIMEDGAKFAVHALAAAIGIPAERLMDEGTAAAVGSGKKLDYLRSEKESDKSSETISHEPEKERTQDRFSEGTSDTSENTSVDNAINQPGMEKEVKKKSKLLPVAVVLMLLVGSAVGAFLPGGGEDVPLPVVAPDEAQAEEPPVDVPVVVPDKQDEDDEIPVDIPAVMPSVEPGEDNIQAAAEMLPEEESTPEEKYDYQIDTVVSNLYSVHDLVMNNSNNIYYISSGRVYSTKDKETLSLADLGIDDFDSRVFLIHDPYKDIVYLLGQDREYMADTSILYDVTDFKSPILLWDEVPICPQDTGFSPQIVVLENGAFIVPASRGSVMVNIELKSVTPTDFIFDMSYSDEKCKCRKVVGNQVIYFYENSVSAKISAWGEEAIDFEFAMATPAKVNSAILYAKHGTVYAYADSIGLCCYNVDGSVDVVIPKESIKVQDFQTLSHTDITALAVGDKDHIAFHDKTLRCIRLIQPLMESDSAPET